MNKKWKYSLNVVAVVVVLGIAISFWLKLEFPEQKSDTHPKKTTPSMEKKIPIETELRATEEITELYVVSNNYEGWERYRNEEYGFEVRYPDDWYIKSEEYGVGSRSIRNSIRLDLIACNSRFGNKDGVSCETMVEVAVHAPTAFFGPPSNWECGGVAAINSLKGTNLQACHVEKGEEMRDEYFIRAEMNYFVFRTYYKKSDVNKNNDITFAVTTRVLESIKFLNRY